MKRLILPVGIVLAVLAIVVVRHRDGEFNPPTTFPVLDDHELGQSTDADSETATFGAGCFWCTEAVFRSVKGIRSAVSGYSGGHIANPTYEQVCSGITGHAEVVQVTFDPKVVSYAELLEVFWRSHDPTTADRQGHDVGSQYRSVVFYHSDRQRELAERYKRLIDEADVFPKPLVTEIIPFIAFYAASTDHQDYYKRNPGRPYCRAVIGRKLDKLKTVIGDRLLTESK